MDATAGYDEIYIELIIPVGRDMGEADLSDADAKANSFGR